MVHWNWGLAKTVTILSLVWGTVAQRTMTAMDLVTLPRPGSPSSSPDGQRVVYAQSTYNTSSDKTANQLWVLDLAAQQDAKAVTELQWGVSYSEPMFLDASHIAFLRRDADKPTPQLFVLDIESQKDPYPVSDFAISIENLKYNRAHGLLVFSASVYDGASLDDTKQRDKDIKETKKDSAMAFDRLMVRHWDTFVSEKKNSLFAIRLQQQDDGRYSLTDQPRNLLAGSGLECPVAPFGDASDFDISPDGQSVAFVAASVNADRAWQTTQHVYLVSTAGNGHPRAINDDIPAASSHPVFSESGHLAYFQMMVPQYESDRNRLTMYNIETGDRQVIAQDWDRSPSSIVFGPNPDVIYVTAEEKGRVRLFQIDMPSGQVTPLTNKGSVGAVAVLPDHRLLFTVSSMQHPALVHTLDLATNQLVCHGSTPNLQSHLDSIVMTQPFEFEFRGSLDDKVHGWLLMPPGHQENTTYPVALLIHGGPQGAWTDSWSTRWNPQVFAAAGYAVVAINPHGSTGYGQRFTDAIHSQWGSYPYYDLQMGLDYVFANYPSLDSERLVGLGASYGGYMINWINGHTTRFKALVNHDGMFSTINSFYTTDELYFPETEFGGTPFRLAARAIYERFSPSNYVSRWKTPTLVIHSARDYRLVDGEGLSTFTALQRQGIPSRLLYFPDENHWVIKHANSLRWHEEVLAWINRWTQSTSPEPRVLVQPNVNA